MDKPISKLARTGSVLQRGEVDEVIARACPVENYRGRRILLIVPDATRTAPIGLLFKSLYAQIGSVTAALDVLIALGTHQPMNDDAICRRLEISRADREGAYRNVKFFNHAWNDAGALKTIGLIDSTEISALSDGLFALDVPVQINRLVFDYDQIVIIGPVFPHEVVGFSGGNKYLFPGVSGPEVLNFFHWLGAVVTNPLIIGHKWTPVRKVVDRAASLVRTDKLCFCLVVAEGGLAGLFAGPPELAWDAASDLSSQLHIVYHQKPFQLILSCAPRMYDELWTGGKCMYKLEPVLADGGELIIYAPHISEVCRAHAATIEKVGYHCRDFFLQQWDQYRHYPWGVLAHSTHVYGQGTYRNGIEQARARVTLATGISEEMSRQVNLGYRDPVSIDPQQYAGRENEGILLVPKAGEMLFRLGVRPGVDGAGTGGPREAGLNL